MSGLLSALGQTVSSVLGGQLQEAWLLARHPLDLCFPYIVTSLSGRLFHHPLNGSKNPNVNVNLNIGLKRNVQHLT